MMKIKWENLAGLGAILIWSTVIAFSRSLSEKIGPLNTAFFAFLFSSLLLFAFQWLKDKRIPFIRLRNISLSYLFQGGSFFIAYMVFFYVAIGTVKSREDTVIIGIINYLWPGLTFLFGVIILKLRANVKIMIIGVITGIGGIAFSFYSISSLSLADIITHFKTNGLANILMLLAAIFWAVYSNITTKFKIEESLISLSLFFFISSLIVLLIKLIGGSIPRLSLNGWDYVEFSYLVLMPTTLAYLFWDIAMKRGNRKIIVAMSFSIPLISTLISGLYLDVFIGINFWIAAALVVIGSIVCGKSIISDRQK